MKSFNAIIILYLQPISLKNKIINHLYQILINDEYDTGKNILS